MHDVLVRLLAQEMVSPALSTLQIPSSGPQESAFGSPIGLQLVLASCKRISKKHGQWRKSKSSAII